jgi:hypothetical protein
MKTYYSGSLFVTGIKKRCRKVDRHRFDVGQFEINEVETEEQKERIKVLGLVIIEEKMKTPIKATLKLNHWTDNGNGMTTWEPFGGKDLDLGTIYNA